MIIIKGCVSVVLMNIIKLIISKPSQHKLRIHQMDVKCAFLDGVFKEEVLIELLLRNKVK